MEFPIGNDYLEGGAFSEGLDFGCISKHMWQIGEFSFANACFRICPYRYTVTHNDTLDIGGCTRLVMFLPVVLE